MRRATHRPHVLTFVPALQSCREGSDCGGHFQPSPVPVHRRDGVAQLRFAGGLAVSARRRLDGHTMGDLLERHVLVREIVEPYQLG